MKVNPEVRAINPEVQAIIRELINGTSEAGKIAKNTNLPLPTVEHTLDELIEQGTIKRKIVLNPLSEVINKKYVGIVLFNCANSGKLSIPRLGKALANIPEIDTVIYTTGKWDILIIFRVKDHEDYYNLITNEIYRIAREHNVTNLVDFFSIKTYKEISRYEINPKSQF